MDKSFLSDFNIDLRNCHFKWKVPPANLFCPVKRYSVSNSTSYDVYHNDKKVKQKEWLNFEKFHWLPANCADLVFDKVEELLPPDNIKISCPAEWHYRIFKNDATEKYYIHMLTANIKAEPHESFKNKLSDKPVIKKLNFLSEFLNATLISSREDAMVYSPDVREPLKLQKKGHCLNINLNNIKRYLIIEI